MHKFFVFVALVALFALTMAAPEPAAKAAPKPQFLGGYGGYGIPSAYSAGINGGYPYGYNGYNGYNGINGYLG